MLSYRETLWRPELDPCKETDSRELGKPDTLAELGVVSVWSARRPLCPSAPAGTPAQRSRGPPPSACHVILEVPCSVQASTSLSPRSCVAAPQSRAPQETRGMDGLGNAVATEPTVLPALHCHLQTFPERPVHQLPAPPCPQLRPAPSETLPMGPPGAPVCHSPPCLHLSASQKAPSTPSLGQTQRVL